MRPSIAKPCSSASMGPRSADRGNACLQPSRPSRADRLQWGRDQLIAEMRLRSPHAATDHALQWGRDQLIAEISRVRSAISEPCIASMGPRSADRGNVARARAGKRIVWRLQWGRDQLIAEIAASRRRKRIVLRHPLQWGRDQLIAEIAPADSRRLTSHCFNGAAIS